MKALAHISSPAQHFPAFAAQSSTHTPACEILTAPVRRKHAYFVEEEEKNKTKKTQQTITTTRSNKHHMTLHIILLNQQRFMGLSRLVAAGPPDLKHAPKTQS